MFLSRYIQSLASKEQEALNQPLLRVLQKPVSFVWGESTSSLTRSALSYKQRNKCAHTCFQILTQFQIVHILISALAYFSRNGRMQGSKLIPWDTGGQKGPPPSHINRPPLQPPYFHIQHLASNIKLSLCFTRNWPPFLCV